MSQICQEVKRVFLLTRRVNSMINYYVVHKESLSEDNIQNTKLFLLSVFVLKKMVYKETRCHVICVRYSIDVVMQMAVMVVVNSFFFSIQNSL